MPDQMTAPLADVDLVLVITVNRNAVPFDPRPPMISSGLPRCRT